MTFLQGRHLLILSLITLILITSACYEITEGEARQIARDFVVNSPTFIFDAIADTLQFVKTGYPPNIEGVYGFVFQFESRHAGYGDRTGQTLNEEITPHEAVVIVEQGNIVFAIMDEEWDMIEQQMVKDDDPLAVVADDFEIPGWLRD